MQIDIQWQLLIFRLRSSYFICILYQWVAHRRIYAFKTSWTLWTFFYSTSSVSQPENQKKNIHLNNILISWSFTLNLSSSDDVSSNDAIGAGPNCFCLRGESVFDLSILSRKRIYFDFPFNRSWPLIQHSLTEFYVFFSTVHCAPS